MRRVFKILLWFLLGVLLGMLLVPSARMARDLKRERETWKSRRITRIQDPGSVKRLTILPLVEYRTDNASLTTEQGISYLVRADEQTILFDLGRNGRRERPSPLLRNMEMLGVSPKDIKRIFISHAHADHIGTTFTTGGADEDLAGIEAYVPAEMSHASFRVIRVSEPRLLAPGIVDMGPIYKAYWGMGMTVEHSLAVNVQNKGIVLIIGCGHATLEKILKRAEELFNVPVYGIVGGLHMPATDFPAGSAFAKFLVRLSATGKQPWHGFFGKSDVRRLVRMLQGKNISLIAASPHDSCVWSLQEFKRTFADRYRDVLLGRPIVIGD